jgi:serine/threonine protein kinase
MSLDTLHVSFDRALYQKLPNPLSLLYRKTFNSSTVKDFHDNALHLGLCLLRILAMTALALWREQRLSIGKEEEELLVKTRRPSEGIWHQWLTRSLVRFRKQQGPAGGLAGQLEEYVHARRGSGQSELPAGVGQLLSYLEKKPVVRQHATVHDFLEALIRYRNETLGHGAVLDEETNQANGQAILRGVEEMARALPLWDEWDLKSVSQVTLEATAVVCRFINLMGPDWLREPPVSFPRGFPAPLPSHVVLVPRKPGEQHLDLHPLLVFHKDCALFFNGFKGRSPSFLDYYSGQPQRLDPLGQDYDEWENSLGATSRERPRSGTVFSKEARPADGAMEVLSAGPQFRLERRLGHGGMGEVWVAYDEILKRNVAIKRIRAELLGRPEISRRFLQEARHVARLNHANIVPILTIDSDANGPYLVLEYLEGGSLRQRLETGSLPILEALSFLRQLLAALQQAHDQGVIHRDIKPENILLTRAGLPKLADFGLAWMLEEADSEAIEVGYREGTRAYLAPELASGSEPPSPRTDLYSLGLTFYEMLTGLPAVPLRENKVPSLVLPLLRKMTSVNPNLRYDSAAACLKDCLELERALELADRTSAETRDRINKTLDKAFALLGERKLVDAQAALERILAEDPDNPRGASGMLLLHLMAGDMPESATRYRALLAAGSNDAVFQRLHDFFATIRRPTVLDITPLPMPFSYQVGGLLNGQFDKDLVECSSDTLNLGDVGELLVELVQRSRADHSVRYEPLGGDAHKLLLQLEGIKVDGEFRIRRRPRGLLRPAKLLGMHLRLTIDAEAFDVYRLVRYLTHRLAQTFKRPLNNWIDPVLAESFGCDAAQALEQWRRLGCDFQRIALENG